MINQDQELELLPLFRGLAKFWWFILLSGLIGAFAFSRFRTEQPAVSSLDAVLYSERGYDFITFLASKMEGGSLTVTIPGQLLHQISVKSSHDPEQALENWAQMANSFLVNLEKSNIENLEAQLDIFDLAHQKACKNIKPDPEQVSACTRFLESRQHLRATIERLKSPIRIVSKGKSELKPVASRRRDLSFGAFSGMLLSTFAIGLFLILRQARRG